MRTRAVLALIILTATLLMIGCTQPGAGALATATATQPATAVPAVTASPAHTAEATDTPTPTRSSAPTDTPRPIHTPTDTIEAREIPTATDEPTPKDTSTPSPQPTSAPTQESTPTPTETCVYALAWAADVTIPDDTELQPGETFTKTWVVVNSGTCAWPAGLVLRHTTGAGLGDAEQVEIEALAAGERTEISVPMTAPTSSGVYETLWNVCEPDGGCISGHVSARIIVPTPVPAAVEQAEPAAPACNYIGNKSSGVLHRASCRYVKRMNESNKVCFATAEEAFAQGYRACKVCTP